MENTGENNLLLGADLSVYSPDNMKLDIYPNYYTIGALSPGKKGLYPTF